MTRYAGVDYLRGVAILSVLAFHYKFLPYGYLGVDLFFVISGFLVGGQLYTRVLSSANWNLSEFYWKRLTKIIPSYLFFLVVAGTFSHLLYSNSHKDYAFPSTEWKSYLFFFINYRPQNSFIFTHLWSLCVEEHFYLFAPLALWIWFGFILKPTEKRLLVAISVAIAAVNATRIFLVRAGHDGAVTTHTRLDAILWGVLAFAIVRKSIVPKHRHLPIALIAVASFSALLIFDSIFKFHFFHEAIFQGLTPIPLCIFVVAVANLEHAAATWLRWFAGYSYNYYLWHMLGYGLIMDAFGVSLVGLVVFGMTGLGMAILVTHFVERPGLKLRQLWVQKPTEFFDSKWPLGVGFEEGVLATEVPSVSPWKNPLPENRVFEGQELNS